MRPLFLTTRLEHAELPCMNEIREAAEFAHLVEREGAGVGSLTTDGLRYSVVEYAICKTYAPSLCEWAALALPAIVSARSGRALQLLNDPRAAVNINVLRGQGEKYELHTDSVPYTAILFVSGPHDGGELIAQVPGQSMRVIRPEPGLLLVFEGAVIPHAVWPLRDGEPRISVPISLTEVGKDYARPAGVDDHLYAPAAKLQA